MKEKLKKIDSLNVLKAFLASHVYIFFAIVAVVIIYVIFSTVTGKNPDQIVTAAQSTGLFSILGISALAASIFGVYRAVSKFLFKKGDSLLDCVALEVLFVIFSLVLYMAVSGFNIFSYLFVMLVPTIAAYYVSKRS